MAYNNNYSETGERSMTVAVDWEAKTVPLKAYISCLTAKEKLQIVMMGTLRDDPVVITHEFVSALSIFYNTVEVSFVSFLKNPHKIKSVKYRGKDFTEEDYDSIVAFCYGINNTNYKDVAWKTFAMFKVLKNWCFEFGPFKTMDSSHTPEEAFQFD